MSRNEGQADQWKVMPLMPQPILVCKSSDPEQVRLSCPSVAALPGGRLIAAVDQFGPGVKKLPGPKGRHSRYNHWLQGRLLISDDKGQTWNERAPFPFCHPCLFRDGDTLYLLGHKGEVQIMKSPDGGMTWGHAATLTSAPGEVDIYSHSPAGVLLTGDSVYVAMMRLTDPDHKGSPAGVLAPEIWQARRGADLTDRRNWVRSASSVTFRDLVPPEALDYTGMPFFDAAQGHLGAGPGGRRWINAMGWEEPHLVRIEDPEHCLCDRSGRTLHLLAVARTHRSNTAVLAKVTLAEAGAGISLETAPSGRKLAFLWLPGGGQKFHLFHDDESKLYWLVSNQSTDSMRRSDRLPRERPGLPADECHRIQLHFSRNLVDWCFAAFVAGGKTDGESMHSCSAAVRGKDLYILSASAGAGRRSAADTDEARLHVIPAFRELAY